MAELVGTQDTNCDDSSDCVASVRDTNCDRTSDCAESSTAEDAGVMVPMAGETDTGTRREVTGVGTGAVTGATSGEEEEMTWRTEMEEGAAGRTVEGLHELASGEGDKCASEITTNGSAAGNSTALLTDSSGFVTAGKVVDNKEFDKESTSLAIDDDNINDEMCGVVVSAGGKAWGGETTLAGNREETTLET
jgi:hypothetical protein